MMLYRYVAGLTWIGLVVGVAAAEQPPEPPHKRSLQEVPLGQVRLVGGFWGPRIETTRTVTVPHALDHLEQDGHVTNFDKAAGKFDGPLCGHHAFDSDLHKALEGACHALNHVDDAALRRRVEAIIDRVLAAQLDNGFLISCWIAENYGQRWDNMRLNHQLYNAGHFFEMAVAHQRLTGRERVLKAATEFADHIGGIFGPGKRYDVGGHEEVELALIKLYRATGERRYLELAKFFLDERGHAHGEERRPFNPAQVAAEIPSFEELPPKERDRARRRFRNSIRNGRMQDHKPLVEQHEAVGHAVRAGYVYAAMADVARLMDEHDKGGYEAGYPAGQYEQALDHLWQDVVGRKMYLTGGIGTAQYHDEGFGDPYLLPNESAYCESCAAIAHVLWQHRMNLLKGEARYADVMELALYNGVLSGIALSGDAFFYQNPLASKKGRERREWIGLSCCPTNLARIIPQVGGLAYVHGDGRIHVNLYAAGGATVELADGNEVQLRQTTDYPWEGRVRIDVATSKPGIFTICLRLPGWAQGKPVSSDLYRYADSKSSPPVLTLNGHPMDAEAEADGYLHLEKRWTDGDVVELALPMPVRRVYAHKKVEGNRGQVALMRGPFVYCLETADNKDAHPFAIALPRSANLSSRFRPDLLGGVTVITGQARLSADKPQEQPPVNFTAIPYYAWANREPGGMTVWISETDN